QVDLILVALIPLLSSKGWKAGYAAAFITLKPISAIIILPWFIIQWLREQPKTVLYFVLASLCIHLAPLLIEPRILFEWISVIMNSGTDHYLGGIGVWLLDGIHPLFLLLSSLVLIALALISKRAAVSRALLALANPFAMFYHAVYLINERSSVRSILMANLGFVLAAITKSLAPLILIPTAFLMESE
ncbi:hypothetical protein LCGC14_2471300, partial [marine sediment metagenome]